MLYNYASNPIIPNPRLNNDFRARSQAYFNARRAIRSDVGLHMGFGITSWNTSAYILQVLTACPKDGRILNHNVTLNTRGTR